MRSTMVDFDHPTRPGKWALRLVTYKSPVTRGRLLSTMEVWEDRDGELVHNRKRDFRLTFVATQHRRISEKTMTDQHEQQHERFDEMHEKARDFYLEEEV